MLYATKLQAPIDIKQVPMQGRSYLDVLKDESGIHFQHDSESDCYAAKVGIIQFQIFLTHDGIRVRMVAGDMLTINHHYDRVSVDGIALIPDMYEAQAFMLGQVAEITARFPDCGYLTTAIGRPNITVIRSLTCDGVNVVSAEYNLRYERIEGVHKWIKIGDDFGTKGTTADRMLARLRKGIEYFQDENDRNFARVIQRADQTALVQKNRESVRSACAGIKGFDPLYEYYDHVTVTIDVMPHQLEALAAFVRTLDQPK